MVRKIDRQIRYNMTTDTGEQVNLRYKWTFFIVNVPEEIKRIRERILNQMAPVGECIGVDEGLIKNSNGLHYDLFWISTDKPEIPDKSKIYDIHNIGRFTKDRNLQDKMTDGLSLWINR